MKRQHERGTNAGHCPTFRDRESVSLRFNGARWGEETTVNKTSGEKLATLRCSNLGPASCSGAMELSLIGSRFDRLSREPPAQFLGETERAIFLSYRNPTRVR